MSDRRTRTLVIGCGNLLRGDDAAGPVLVRRRWERGLRDGVECADGIRGGAGRREGGGGGAEEGGGGGGEEGAGRGGAGFGGGNCLVAVDLEDSVQMLLEQSPTPRLPQ